MTLGKVLLSACAVSFCGIASAADFSFTGTFTQDDDVQLFNFVVGAPSSVTLRTWSYAGGTNAEGDTIARGGFDPILALFDSSGALVDQNDDGGFPLVAPDSATGQRWDTYLTAALTAGTYTVSVMQYNNFAAGPNLSDGFVRSGEGNFTDPSCAGTMFCDVSGSQRDGHWAFDVLNVNSAVVVLIPEPETYALLLAGLGLLGFVVRRRREFIST